MGMPPRMALGGLKTTCARRRAGTRGRGGVSRGDGGGARRAGRDGRAPTSLLTKMRSSPSGVFQEATCAPWRYTSDVHPVDEVSVTPGRSPRRVVSPDMSSGRSARRARKERVAMNCCSKIFGSLWKSRRRLARSEIAHRLGYGAATTTDRTHCEIRELQSDASRPIPLTARRAEPPPSSPPRRRSAASTLAETARAWRR